MSKKPVLWNNQEEGLLWIHEKTWQIEVSWSRKFLQQRAAFVIPNHRANSRSLWQQVAEHVSICGKSFTKTNLAVWGKTQKSWPGVMCEQRTCGFSLPRFFFAPHFHCCSWGQASQRQNYQGRPCGVWLLANPSRWRHTESSEIDGCPGKQLLCAASSNAAKSEGVTSEQRRWSRRTPALPRRVEVKVICSTIEYRQTWFHFQKASWEK